MHFRKRIVSFFSQIVVNGIRSILKEIDGLAYQIIDYFRSLMFFKYMTDTISHSSGNSSINTMYTACLLYIMTYTNMSCPHNRYTLLI